MKCPYRKKENYTYGFQGDKVFVTSVEEEYPVCYEDECPHYEQFGTPQCVIARLEQEGNT